MSTSPMRTAEEITARLLALENAKAMLLCPPMICISSNAETVGIVWKPGQILPPGVEVIPPNATLESLNAEIAALTWALGTTLSEQEVG